MDSDDEATLPPSQAKQYAVLRSDLSAALAAFDRAQDWADLIHDLQRVNRVLNKHSSSTFLPEKTLLAKRLSQCLTSFLPSGVHLKALETYHLVFKRIGSARLARDLPLYAGGLFPLFSHCATSLKAPLLSLYETYFLPLGVALCPVLDGFVLAILPGVEDESSEFYVRSRNLLDRLADAVNDIGIFARSLWRALLLSPPMRLSAAHYLRLKLAADNDGMRAEMVSDMPLVAYAITAALSDDDALTQRSVLDLLLGELALDSPFFEIKSEKEREAAVAVVGGVLGALLKRDMSLTKRVHAWFLGGKDTLEGIGYCKQHSNELVLAAIDRECRLLLGGSGGRSVVSATRPCRIAAALMDREELSECLGHHFALRVLQYGLVVTTAMETEYERDIRHVISDLLQDLGSGRVFAELERMLTSGKEKTLTDFELLTFALSLFPTTNEVVRRKHLPALLRVAVQSLNAVSTDNLTLDKAVSFCTKAIQAMGRSRNARMEEDVIANVKATVSSFASFFVAWLAHVIELAPVELRRPYNDVTVAEEYAADIRMAAICESRMECINLAKGACSFFVSAATSEIGGIETLQSSLQATAKCASAADVRISLAGARAFADISAKVPYNGSSTRRDDEQVFGVIRRCWRQLHPSLRTATPQSAQALLGLQHRFPEETKIVIADGILSAEPSRRLRNLERFACLWRLAVEHRLMPFPSDNGLFLMLDALTDEDWAPKMLARSWLSDALEVDAASVVDAPLRLLLTPESRTVGPQHEFVATYDAPRALYGFQVMRGILESCATIDGSKRKQGYILRSPSQFARRDGKRGLTGVLALAAAAVSARTNQAVSAVFAKGDTYVNDSRGPSAESHSAMEGPVLLSQLLPAPNYVVVVALTCLGYLRGHVPSRLSLSIDNPYADSDRNGNGTSLHPLTSMDFVDDDDVWLSAGLGFKSLGELHGGVCAAAAECLATLFRAIHVPSQLSAFIANVFAEPVLTLVENSVDSADPVLQLHFIDAVSFLVTADGPSYLSSVEGKEAFMKPETGRIRLSYSESQNQLPGVKPADQVSRGVQLGSVETQDRFVPWLLDGVSATYRSAHLEQDRGSHEVLGVRRRWIQFIETVMRNVGVTLPTIAEGLLVILSELLSVQNKKVISDQYLADSEFSRVDETLILLEGLAVVTSNVLWSFEYALSNADLNDDSQADFTYSGEGHQTQYVSSLQDANLSANREDANHLASIEETASANISQNGHVGTVGQPVAAATAMINAINPLRMINDFVKDVLSGAGSDGAQRLFDPRRSGARLLFCLLPEIMRQLARVYGPLAESSISDSSPTRVSLRVDDNSPPRLSTELPKERRQAQRVSVLAVLEPVFELRQTDVVASVIALFASEQDDFGAMKEEEGIESSANVACQILHALEEATPDAVVASVGQIFDKSVKWDSNSVDAKEGRSQCMLRRKAKDIIHRIIESGTRELTANEIKAVGQVALGEVGSEPPGGTIGLDTGRGFFRGSGHSTSGHTGLFHYGDFFAVYAPGRVETACFNFLEVYLSSRRDAEEVRATYPVLYGLLKDALASCRRRSTVLMVLKVLGTFVTRSLSPFPDRKSRRDIMNLAISAINTCSNIASCSLDITSDELGEHGKDMYKKELSVLALQALTSTVPALVDSTFLDDKPQLSSTVSSCLLPAVAALKKAASRAASKQALAEKKLRNSPRELSPTRHAEQRLDVLASKAAIDVILNVSNRDWGVKHARRELLGLLEDPNFFYGKGEGVLEKTSKIVGEVVASGGAASLLTSIGSSTANGAPGIPSLFTGRDSETVLRARAIRRIAYCVFVSEPDFYSPQLPSVLEKIRDALRMGEARLIVECLLCLRALLVRIGPSSISAFRATTLSEMFRIACNPTEDLNATVAALQFLDLTALLSPADYSYERCFFFGETDLPDVIPGSELKPFRPLAISLSSLWVGEDRSLEETFKPPLRREGGRTVLAGNAQLSMDREFVGRYANALMKRNAMPEMKAIAVDMQAICVELEHEFAQ